MTNIKNIIWKDNLEVSLEWNGADILSWKAGKDTLYNNLSLLIKLLSTTLNSKILNCVPFSLQKQSEEKAAQETSHGNISFDIGRWDWTWRFCVSN